MIFKDLVAFQTIFLLVASNGNTEKIGRCYVCVPKEGSNVAEVTQMFPEGPSVLSCDEFRPEKRYERTCPSAAYVGCLTQTDGTRITKTCSDVDVHDCKTANRIKYCYCKGDLCNKEPSTTEISSEEQMEDDEDSPSEGSGWDEPTDFAPSREDGFLTTEKSLPVPPTATSRGESFSPTAIFLVVANACIFNIR